MMFDDAMLTAAHNVTSKHRELMLQSLRCGCCYCLRVFPTSELGTESGIAGGWVDNGTTAICPYCCVDCLIPEASGYPLIPEFLQEMHRKWFSEATLATELKRRAGDE